MPVKSIPRAPVADVHELASALPGVTRKDCSAENPIYTVSGKSFVLFRNPRPDAVDPETGKRYNDVIVFWVGSEAANLPWSKTKGHLFFTTSHFDGYPAVLVRASHLDELDRVTLVEVIADAWLSRSSKRVADRLAENPIWPRII
ncbi:MAG: hypothetical protein HKO03_13475 [Acidimicrobiia bacterium]|nr:hypothetical protein [Acidimicrobiia bacterium]